MKAVVAAIGIAVVTSVHSAELTPQQKQQINEIKASTDAVINQVNAALAAEGVEECNRELTIAGNIMRKRQDGELVTSQLSEAKLEMAAIPDLPAWVPDRINGIVLEAYKVPRYTSANIKTKAITDFQNDTYISCRTWWDREFGPPSRK